MTKTERIGAVLFDFDGTLAELSIDFDEMRSRVWAIVEELGVPRSALQSRYVLELIDEAAGMLDNEDLERTLRQETRQAMEEVELDAAENGATFPWLEEMASELAGIGVKSGIVTRNCRKAVTKVLGPSLALFQALVTRDETRTVKPDPQHLFQALGLLPGPDLSPERTMMVGDHPMDVKCAKQAGMYAVGVMTGAGNLETLSKERADLILPDASQVPAFVSLLNGGKAPWLDR